MIWLPVIDDIVGPLQTQLIHLIMIIFLLSLEWCCCYQTRRTPSPTHSEANLLTPGCGEENAVFTVGLKEGVQDSWTLWWVSAKHFQRQGERGASQGIWRFCAPFSDWLRVRVEGKESKNPPAMQETRVWSLVWKDALEKEMATHSSKNSMNRGAWWAIVQGVAKSQTLSD